LAVITTFTVDGIVRGKARPRFVVHGGRGRAVTPRRTREYQSIVERVGTWARPKGWPRGKTDRYRVELEVHHSGGHVVDLDNAAKGILDALNGVLWYDDRQVEELSVRRIRGGEARAVIRVEWLGEAVKVPPKRRVRRKR
jgi:Holliday junction resolvase RusA-like endonuclease